MKFIFIVFVLTVYESFTFANGSLSLIQGEENAYEVSLVETQVGTRYRHVVLPSGAPAVSDFQYSVGLGMNATLFDELLSLTLAGRSGNSVVDRWSSSGILGSIPGFQLHLSRAGLRVKVSDFSAEGGILGPANRVGSQFVHLDDDWYSLGARVEWKNGSTLFRGEYGLMPVEPRFLVLSDGLKTVGSFGEISVVRLLPERFLFDLSYSQQHFDIVPSVLATEFDEGEIFPIHSIGTSLKWDLEKSTRVLSSLIVEDRIQYIFVPKSDSDDDSEDDDEEKSSSARLPDNSFNVTASKQFTLPFERSIEFSLFYLHTTDHFVQSNFEDVPRGHAVGARFYLPSVYSLRGAHLNGFGSGVKSFTNRKSLRFDFGIEITL